MSPRRGLRIAVCLTLLVAPVQGRDVLAYEVETHKKISEIAATRSAVDERLKQSLGISAGLDLTVRGQSLLEWIEEGSVRADDWTYFVNHFHNPLAGDWSQAGLGPAYSAILWGQTPNQGYPSWSWQNTRQYFLDALTSTQKVDRDLALTMTFQGLGHLIHLIQDMASPAHTRNDPHRSYNYETLVRDVQLDPELPVAQVFLDWIDRPSLGPDPGWQALARNDLAPIPIARLVDTDLYSGANPEATIQPLMGLAEYTNANYFSEDRIFRENDVLWRFPYPRRSSVTEADSGITLGDGTPVTRQYFRKDFHGDSGYRLATVGFLRDYIQRYGLDPGRYGDSPALDEAVYRDYAERLLPRAVGYSAVLLDYFFRGKLEVKIEANPADSEKLQLTTKNASSEPLGGGTLAVYGDYAGGERRPFGSWQIQVPVAPGGDLPSQSFSPDKPMPARYMVVYQGGLGEEKKDNPPGFRGAVIGKAATYGGIIETIFSTYPDEEIYFRDSHGVTNLELRRRLPGTYLVPHSIQWGQRDDSFLVQTADIGPDGELVYLFHVVTLDRPGPGRTFDQRPTVKAIRTEAYDLSWYTPGVDVEDNGFPYLDANGDIILSVTYRILSGDDATAHPVLLDLTTKTVLLDINARSFNPPVSGDATGVWAGFSVLYLDPADPKKSRIAVEGQEVVVYFDISVDPYRFLWYVSVIDGEGSVVMTMLPWTENAVPIPQVVFYSRAGFPGTRRHMLWGQSGPYPSGERVFLSSFDDGVTREIASNLAEFEVFRTTYLMPVAPDYLLRVSGATPYFVKGWGRDGAILLDPLSTPGFPAEDTALAPLKRLADLPPGVVQALYRSAWHVVEDPDLLK